jgi:peptidoglycan/LPS O-acetylase OafA/YrhL
MTAPYRPEIDGLRAIAVCAVVAYHAGLSPAHKPLSGGFLGVDIFFVISGYLITSIILRALANGSFTFAHFYERRARRILPALFVVIAATIPFAAFYMTSGPLKDYARSAISAVLFSSNFRFWLEDGYFAEINAVKPLLHTWSLAVEEQFYLLFPVLLWGLVRHTAASTRAVVMTGLITASFAWAVFASDFYPQAAFYLLPARGWELLAGAMLAKFELDRGRHIRRRWLDRVMVPAGLAMIAYALFVFDDHISHPSYATLVPVAGTMIVLWFARPGEFVTDLLSSRPAVTLGLISYSLYLWHFPIFAFANMASLEPQTYFDRLWQIALALVLAAVTYRYIEKPARNAAVVPLGRLAPATAGVAALLVAIQWSIIAHDGLPHRFGDASKMIAEATSRSLRQNGRQCSRQPIAGRCRFSSDPPSAITLINIGDSHAMNLGPGLLNLAKARGWNYEDIATGGCPYIVGGMLERPGARRSMCQKHVAEAQAMLLSLPPSLLVISGRFPRYLSGRPFDNQEGGVESGDTDLGMVADPARANGRSLRQLIEDSILDLLNAGHSVVLVYPFPEAGWHIPRRVVSALRRSLLTRGEQSVAELDITTSSAVYRDRTRQIREIFDGLGDRQRLHRVVSEDLFCSRQTGRCRTLDAGGLFYADSNHLAPRAARLVVEKIGLALPKTIEPASSPAAR